VAPNSKFRDFSENQMTNFQIWSRGALTIGGVWSRNRRGVREVLGGIKYHLRILPAPNTTIHLQSEVPAYRSLSSFLAGRFRRAFL